MNLRIEAGEFRFRISKEELETLCNGTSLSQQTFLPGQRTLHVEINIQDQPKNLLLTFEENHITLQVQKGAAKDLYQALPSREGLETEQEIDDAHMLKLMLEVDIRTQKRKRGEP